MWYYVAYASAMDELLGQSALWIHGRTHRSDDHQVVKSARAL